MIAWFRSGGSFCSCLIALLSAATTEAETNRPNVVLIMTDNHGAWTLGCYGNRDIRTPNIDRLATEGTLFENAFASNPVCSPTRATVLTGLIPSQHGVHCFLRGGRLQVGPEARCTLDEFTSLPEILKTSGYKCGLVGKWHLGANMSVQEGFDDYWITMPHGGTSTFYDAQVIDDGEIRKEPEYLTDFWTRHAVNFIEQQSNEQPFFLFLSYNGPYALSRLLLREGRNRHAAYYRDQDLPSFPRETPHPWQLHNLDYINNPPSIRRVATEVSGVDDGVGTIMQTLKEQGFSENTIVVFLADQGWVGGHGGFFGMGDHTQPVTARDGMMRIPMIWRQPGRIAGGRRTRKLVANYDVLPTMLEMAGIDLSTVEQPAVSTVQSPGRSFSEHLYANSGTATEMEILADDAVYYEFESLRCIRTHEWKYVHRHPNGPHELYDLTNDPDEFNNQYQSIGSSSNQNLFAVQSSLKRRLDEFFAQNASPRYDLYNGGGSQTVIYDGIEEEIAQVASIDTPPLPEDFTTQQFTLPDGFRAELVAGPPLVNHPTMGCFDDIGRLFVCDGAGVNMSAAELEAELPNHIRMLEDTDGDGRFDNSTIFADKMTFPMGGAWHDGALYVASPPNIWRLEDADGDGVADKRDIIVDKFGYTGNAASIHGCFFSPDGRLYWCDGYHGHEFKDDDGNVFSSRKGSYIFSCQPDGSDVRIHCGGGMDNPVEVDFTEEGDVIGTVNILYTRPRIDCLVHWQYGGAYPHREAFLEEWPVTGDLLEPIHKFGHVAVSGTTRYRSGVMNHNWKDNFFVTQFNLGRIVRMELERSGSTYSATERQFLSCNNRDFHPTDVIEDADGSLLVVDTGGWFYRGCPTSQISKPDVLGGIYRIRRNGMTTVPDPRGNRVDWTARTDTELMRDLKDTRFAAREKAIQECVRRGEKVINRLAATARSADLPARRNALWTLARLASNPVSAEQPSIQTAICNPLFSATNDRHESIRQTAWRCIAAVRPSPEIFQDLSDEALVAWEKSYAACITLTEQSPAVRREMFTALSQSQFSAGHCLLLDIDPAAFQKLSREERHAVMYALFTNAPTPTQSSRSLDLLQRSAEHVTVLNQLYEGGISSENLQELLHSEDDRIISKVSDLIGRKLKQGTLSSEQKSALQQSAEARVIQILKSESPHWATIGALSRAFPKSDVIPVALSPWFRKQSAHDSLQAVPVSTQQLSAAWMHVIEDLIAANDMATQLIGVKAARTLGSQHFSHPLWTKFESSKTTPTFQSELIQALAGAGDTSQREELAEQLLELASADSIELRDASISALARMSHPATRLSAIAELLPQCSPQQLNDLVPLFKRSLSPELTITFLDNIENARALNSLPMIEVSEVVKRFPPELHDRANALLDRMKAAEQARLVKLDSLIDQVKIGNTDRGRKVFFSEKAKCATCHVVGTANNGELLGKRVGPDLTTIGSNRSAQDLLESILFPSATIVRQYEPYTLITTDGRSFSGLVVEDTSISVTIQQSTGDPVTVPQTDIEEFVPGTVSIMPKGLDEQLTPQQIADLVAWLQTLRTEGVQNP